MAAGQTLPRCVVLIAPDPRDGRNEGVAPNLASQTWVMQSSELATGRDYAWSPTLKSPRDEMRKVRYLGSHRSGKVKIKWLDGEFEGLDEWTPTRLGALPVDGARCVPARP